MSGTTRLNHNSLVMTIEPRLSRRCDRHYRLCWQREGIPRIELLDRVFGVQAGLEQLDECVSPADIKTYFLGLMGTP